MSDRPTTLERAFELARSGECATPGDIKQRLRREGFDGARAIFGPALMKQLRELCAASRPSQD